MKKVQKKYSIISTSFFVLISLISLLIGCGEGESKLVGKWIIENGSVQYGFPDDLELFKDGTGISEERSINWKVDNNRFIVTSSSKGFALNYKTSDSTLTLTDDNGKSVEYYNFAYLKKREEAKIKAVEKATMIDKRDGKTYKTVKIGTQTWMAENLNYNAESSECYEDDDSNCVKYGRLYNWNTAKKVCPEGWHIPTYADCTTLINYVGDFSTAGKYLKATSGWDDNYNGESGNGEDNYGFAALPGGSGDFAAFRRGDSGRLADRRDFVVRQGGYVIFGFDGSFGYWWSAYENDASHAGTIGMRYLSEDVVIGKKGKSEFLSVRCLLD